MEIRTRVALREGFRESKRSVMEGLSRECSDLPEVTFQNVEIVIGELLGNTAKYEAENEEVTVGVRVDSEYVYLVVESRGIRDNCDVLSQVLGLAQECVNRGIGCDFFLRQHGLGHLLIAKCADESSYFDGVFRAKFGIKAENVINKSGVLVDLALA